MTTLINSRHLLSTKRRNMYLYEN